MKDIAEKIKQNLTEDLLKKEFKGKGNKYYGHCYVATEALYHLLGKKRYKPKRAKDENGNVHWWLEDEYGNIADVTREQYDDLDIDPPYENGRFGGFLTKEPSKRAKILMERVKNEI